MDEKKKEKKTSNVYAGFSEIRTKRVAAWIKEKRNSKAYRKYRQNWEEYPKQLKIPDFPMHLDIESSSNCNLRCPMCARTVRVNKGIWRKNQSIDLELFKKIIDEAAKEGVCALNLNNFGEPLINPHLAKMVKYAKSKGIIDVFFHTNAVLLTKKISRALIEAGLDRIVISIDSPYKEKFERIRIGTNYELVVQNLKGLFEVRKEMNSLSPLIRINMIKFPDLTKKEVNDMKKKFLGIVDSIGFLELYETNPDKTKKVEFPHEYKSKFICPQLISRLSILENGDVAPCCVDIDANMKLGNVKEKSLKEMWTGSKLNELRKIHFKGKFFEIPTCRNCDWAVAEDKRLRNEAKGNK